MSLSGRHALVTGASQGIGRAAALALARRGAQVTLLARNADRLATVRDQCQREGASAAHVLQADLDDRAGLADKLVNHLDRHGAIQILVHNTGGPPSAPLLDASEQDIMTAIGRHVAAAQLMVQLCLPGMKEAAWGRIVNVLSTSVREPIPNLGVSNLTRAAMASWAKTLSRELPPGITINSVLPGFTDTERLSSLAGQVAGRTGKSEDDVQAGWLADVPEGRLGRPEELGAAIAFLCSPEASFIRGVVLPVDGGRLRSI